MAQLVIVVLAIVLTAIVVAGGGNYLHADLGVKTSTAERVITALNVLETGFRSYRIANRGALPTAGDVSTTGDEVPAWRAEILPYLPSQTIDTPDRMIWDYIEISSDSGQVEALCLHTLPDTEVSEAQHSALVSVSNRVPLTLLAKDCEASEPAIGFDGAAALILPIRTTL